MRPRLRVAASAVLLAIVGASQGTAAQSEQSSIDLVVKAGRPLRVALDTRISLKRVGQPVTGTVTEPIYVYDRIVIPIGATVRGHVAQLDRGSRLARTRAYLGGNFSPPIHAVLQFETLRLDDGREMPIDTIVTGGMSNVTRHVAGGSKAASKEEAAANDDRPNASLTVRARSEIRQQTSEAVASMKQKVAETLASIRSLKQPGQLNHLKEAAIQQLPYHPQYLGKGTVYDAQLSSSLFLGTAVPAAQAPAGTRPAPDSILTARLATTLDSSKTPRGTSFDAIVTETVFSADHQVVLPEGTKLTGEVTQAVPARRWHRNGRLRFLFEQVQVPDQPSATLLGSLQSVDAVDGDHVAIDDEGGATLENSKTRFIAPTVALLMLHASAEQDGHRYADPDGDGSIKTAGSGVGARGVGGFVGFGLLGAALGQITRPVGIALAAYGAVRTTYSNVLGKGREVTFPTDTPIQVRLASGPSQ